MRRRLLLYGLALGTVSFWGASFPLSKAALDFVGPTALAFLRWMVSALVLIGWTAATGQQRLALEALRGHGGQLAGVGLTGITLFYFLENLALRYTTATNAGVLSNLTSVFMVLLGVLWLRERLRWLEWLGLGIAFLGAGLVSQGAGHLTLGGAGLRGDLLMVIACVFGAFYSVAGKRLVALYPADVVMALVAALGAGFLLPLALIEGLSFALPLQVWGAVLLLGLGAGALANLWWLRLLSRVDASRAGMALFLIPVISTLLSVIALGEPLTPLIVLGSTLVLAGVAAVRRRT